MNIIWLCPEMIYPVNTGARVVIYNRIKQFKKMGHNIHLICIVDTEDEMNNTEDLETICRSVTLINRNQYKVTNMFNFIWVPFCVGSRTNNKIKKSIKDIIDNEEIELVICEFPQMAYNLIKISPLNGKIDCVLSQHNVEFQSMKSLASSYQSWIRRSIFKIEAWRLKKYENTLYQSNIFSKYIFVSDMDKIYFESNFNHNKVKTILSPIGSDNHTISKSYACLEERVTKNIVIVGKMSYAPNVEGVLWFCNKIFPIVADKITGVKLYIVGKDPTSEIIALQSNQIIVTGTVESVIEYYELSDLVVVPIFTGGGVKTKLIEAASFGKPIISTTFGVAGTSFQRNIHLLVEDDNVRFAEACIEILQNAEEYNLMTKNCNNHFNEKYTWEGICKSLNSNLNGLENV